MPKTPEQPHYENVDKDQDSKEPEKLAGEEQEEYQRRLQRIANIGRVVGEDFDMKVVTGDKPGWRYMFDPVNTIEVDPGDLREKGVAYCMGVICHEGAHRKISRVDFIPERLLKNSSFHFLGF